MDRLMFSMAVVLLLAGAAQAQTACLEATGSVNVTADNGVMLFAGKTQYEVNNMTDALMHSLTLQNELLGSFKICPTGNHDRFGDQVVNILGVKHLLLVPTPQ
jgi:hypothetical protein